MLVFQRARLQRVLTERRDAVRRLAAGACTRHRHHAVVLHWLPIAYGIRYEFCLTTYAGYNGSTSIWPILQPDV